MKIALFDSGVNEHRNEIDSSRCIHKNTVRYINDPRDNLGHGTAIAYILQRRLPQAFIVSYKFFEKEEITEEREILEGLQEILDNELDIQLINISCGITFIHQYELFYEICEKLKRRGCVIVSAYDNAGYISFPAGFDNTIGVYWDIHVRNVGEYYFVEQSPIEILGYAGNQRLPWGDEESRYVAGSSFATPYITAKVALMQEKQPSITLDQIRGQLKEQANKIFKRQPVEENEQKLKRVEINKLNKIIIYPINKEMQAVIGNQDLLSFEICGVYDYRYSDKLNKLTSEFVHINKGKDILVKRFEDIDWKSDFDTILVGHLDRIDAMLNINSQKEILDLCQKYRKNCFLLDDISNYDLVDLILSQGQVVMTHQIKNLHISNFICGGCHKISIPVVAVVGTSPKQGKFNIQLELRRRLLRDGYEIGQVGTEPTAQLFGMDVVFSNGYNNSYNITDEKEILYINECIFQIGERDIILIGTQSNTIPYRFGNIGFLSIHQQNMLTAAEPDATILCINADDEFEYIGRTISVLKSFYMTKVIALVVYPVHKEMEWNTNLVNSKAVGVREASTLKENLTKTFGIPAYINGIQEDMDNLYECMLMFFA